ncbi:E3 ubiquitin-protein ligase SMURF2 [Elysia marginata]|uniref:E3 ubiquitin-protein ligase SMURF2 n=1 Tax=Elysia marginata TaxID=1093978 RepID=A0AAV4H9T1_9GAST|nr:E3 ubiquitin-protein ligase SMURF2 [Elysia marginata]
MTNKLNSCVCLCVCVPAGLPDPFAKITVDGSGQCHSTAVLRNTLDPKWNQHYDLYVGHKDSITISVWNHKKIHKKQGAGFLGCVRIMPNAMHHIKDTGLCVCVYVRGCTSWQQCRTTDDLALRILAPGSMIRAEPNNVPSSSCSWGTRSLYSIINSATSVETV